MRKNIGKGLAIAAPAALVIGGLTVAAPSAAGSGICNNNADGSCGHRHAHGCGDTDAGCGNGHGRGWCRG